MSQEQSSSDPAQTLFELRQRIDALDDELVRLMSERGRLAQEIGKIKAQSGAAVYAPDRESEIFERLRRINPGPFPDRVLQSVYRELMSGSFVLERPLRVAFLGPRGSYSHLAATEKFGASVEYEPVIDIPAAFAEVDRAHADLAVVPVENSLGGGVIDTLDAFLNSSARICAELYRRIRHNLMSRSPIEAVEKVYSKPEVFEQCRRWLTETGLIAKTVPVASTSRAAELAAAEHNAAALGSALAAELHGIPIQFTNVEDDPNNTTRFFVIARESARPTGDDKTAVAFATPDRAGALVDVLDVFRAECINLTMITSRPSRRKNWEYIFFLDSEGHQSDPAMARALEAAATYCSQFTVLGSFPIAREIT